MTQRLSEITRYGEPGTSEQLDVSKKTRDMLERVQGRIEEYCETLISDIDFDRRVAQQAEHACIEELAKQDQTKISVRERRLNALTYFKFRRRLHDEIARIATILKTMQTEKSTQTQINVNITDGMVSEDDFRDALKVLTESGISGLSNPDESNGNGRVDDAVRDEGQQGNEGETET